MGGIGLAAAELMVAAVAAVVGTVAGIAVAATVVVDPEDHFQVRLFAGAGIADLVHCSDRLLLNQEYLVWPHGLAHILEVVARIPFEFEIRRQKGLHQGVPYLLTSLLLLFFEPKLDSERRM